IKRGDVIESFNGQAVHDTNTLRNRVAEAGPGTTAELVIVRDGSEKKLSVKLDEANPDKLARGRGERGCGSDGTQQKASRGGSGAWEGGAGCGGRGADA